MLAPAGPGGVWGLAGEGAVLREAADGGPATILVPTEQVLLTAVDLPLPSRRQRLAALPFAIEDRIAAPIETVHVALGQAVAPGRYLAGVATPAVMLGWTAQAQAAGLGQAALVPDALTLPVPAAGAWSVERTGDRVLVRAEDGTGFAVSAPRFAALWAAAGQPACILFGDPLPDAIPGVAAEIAPGGLAERLRLPALDLRQGAFARPRRGTSALWRRAAIVAGCGLLAHGAIAAADTIALQRIAAERKAETRAIVERIAPGTSDDGDLAEVAGDLLPVAGGVPGAAFLPAVAKVSGALGGGVTLRALAYDAGAGTLVLDVAAADLTAVQALEARLRAAGLSATGGGGTVAAGGAEGRITVRTGGAG